MALTLAKSAFLSAVAGCARMTIVRHFKARKRFYNKVSITKATTAASGPHHSLDSDWYEIILDQRKLKTPLGSVLHVPGEALAIAVAEEWDAQVGDIRLNEMHLTALCNTAIDNPSKLTSSDLVDRITSFLETDTILHFEDRSSDLGKLQEKIWGDVVDWFVDFLEVQPSDGRIIPVDSPLGVPEVPRPIVDRFRRHLLAGDFWSLHGFWYGTDSTKSSILTTAAVAGKLSVEEAVGLSRLETEFQASRWGRVEWAHDVETESTKARLAAAVIFTRLNSASERLLLKGTKEA